MKKIITTEGAPQAIGPYSQGIRTSGGFVFLSGQIPIDPETGELVAGGIKEQTERVLENLKAVLIASACLMDDVIKVTVYLQNIDDFAAMNTVYARYFPDEPPARTCVEVARLPKGALLEIDIVASPAHEMSY